jgi:UDP:flavonoid glycosyltransferase YjiC (YdhE family)
MRLLCLSAQLPGHLDWGGYLATATELARRGHAVTWASGAAVAVQVARHGLPFVALAETGWRWPPPPPLPDDPAAAPHAVMRQRQLRALDQWLDPPRVAAAVSHLTEVVAAVRPNLILTEMFVAAAGIVAEQTGVPLAVIGWPAPASHHLTAADDMIVLARLRLDDLLARYGLRGVNWTPAGPPALCAPRLHLTYWSSRWFGGATQGDQTVHVGGLAGERHPGATPAADFTALPAPDHTPWVLVTLGTSFNADPNFFIAAAHAADQLGCVPILALGAPPAAPWVQQMRGRLPRSAVVRERVDFAAVLPNIAAAIHHGGAGTTHALVRYAVPQIVVPHAADQVRQAQGIMRCRVGLHIPPKQASVGVLVDALAQTLPDLSPLRAAAVDLQAEFHALGGVPAAADTIEALGVGGELRLT